MTSPRGSLLLRFFIMLPSPGVILMQPRDWICVFQKLYSNNSAWSCFFLVWALDRANRGSGDTVEAIVAGYRGGS